MALVNKGRYEAGPNVLALVSERTRGCCVCCDGPLTKRSKVVCAEKDCLRMYQRAHGQDRHIRLQAKGILWKLDPMERHVEELLIENTKLRLLITQLGGKAPDRFCDERGDTGFGTKPAYCLKAKRHRWPHVWTKESP